jgi:predicted aspartyl protease
MNKRMAAKNKNTRLKSNMNIAFCPAQTGVGRLGSRRPKDCDGLVFSAFEGDVDPYIIIFAVLAVVVCLCLYSVLGQRTGSERPFRVSTLTYRLSMIAAVLGTVNYVAYEAKWYAAIEAALMPIAVPIASAPGADSVPIYPTNHGTSAMIDVQLGVQPLRMLLDTGATTCLISEAIAARIVRDGYGVWQGTDRFKMADGTIRTLPTLLIREVRIGRHTVRTVRAGVSSTGEMLLAFPVVNAIAPFTIDTRTKVLIFHTSSKSIGGGHIAASTTAAPTISGPARVIDGDTVVVVGILLAMALLLGTALVLSFRQWKAWKAQKSGQGVYLKRLLLTALNKLRNRFRSRLTPGEIQRREQRSHTRL